MPRSKKQVITWQQLVDGWANIDINEVPKHGLGNPLCCVVGTAHGFDEEHYPELNAKLEQEYHGDLEVYKCNVCVAYSLAFYDIGHLGEIQNTRADDIYYGTKYGAEYVTAMKNIIKFVKEDNLEAVRRLFLAHMLQKHTDRLIARGLIKQEVTKQ